MSANGPFAAGRLQRYSQPYPPQYPPQSSPYPQRYPVATSNGMGIAGFVTGLLGVILFWVPVLGLILGALGIVLGGVAAAAAHKAGATNGLAMAGLVLGIISTAGIVLLLIALA